VTGVQTCALPISPKPQNPKGSHASENNLDKRDISQPVL